MLNVTEQAGQAIKIYLAGQDVTSDILRVFLSSGCGGGSLRIALDEVNEKDNVYELDGLKYAIDQALETELGDVFVDLIADDDGQEYFHITTTNPLPFKMDCSSCTSCG